MEQPQQPPLYGNDAPQQDYRNPQFPLPNAGAILTLGIISIVGCCCYGIVGLVCGIIALVMAKTAEQTYSANPIGYTESSYSNVKTGKTCAWIGIILSILYIIINIVVLIIYGAAALSDPQFFMNQFS